MKRENVNKREISHDAKIRQGVAPPKPKHNEKAECDMDEKESSPNSHNLHKLCMQMYDWLSEFEQKHHALRFQIMNLINELAQKDMAKWEIYEGVNSESVEELSEGCRVENVFGISGELGEFQIVQRRQHKAIQVWACVIYSDSASASEETYHDVFYCMMGRLHFFMRMESANRQRIEQIVELQAKTGDRIHVLFNTWLSECMTLPQLDHPEEGDTVVFNHRENLEHGLEGTIVACDPDDPNSEYEIEFEIDEEIITYLQESMELPKIFAQKEFKRYSTYVVMCKAKDYKFSHVMVPSITEI